MRPITKFEVEIAAKWLKNGKANGPDNMLHYTELEKPNKPVGEKNSLRRLTLCNRCRKLLSLITLRRIEDKVDAYTGPWQAAYKKKRSCGDWVWCHRMLISLVK